MTFIEGIVMLIKEDVMNIIENIIKEPTKRDGGLPKEIQILEAVENMEEHGDEIVRCANCFYYHINDNKESGVCDYHYGQCYPDDYCSFGINKS